MNAPVTFSLDADGVGWIVFDHPDSRVNVFNPATQAALATAIASAAASAAKAVVVQSAKERIFIAGADLQWLGALPDEATATDFSRSGQSLFQQLAALKIPVVCAIHGACAGGGYELALACSWRVASDAEATQIGLPEIGLGTIPGWGGSVRLPRLIGAVAALGHMLQAKLLSSGQALAAGLVDEVVPAADLKARAKAAALRLAATRPPVRPPPPAPAPGHLEELRRSTRRKLRGQQPAPLLLIDVVEQTAGLDLAAALAIEARAFGQVTAGEVCKNLVSVFFLRATARKRTLDGWFPVVPDTPPPVRRVGVVGAGVMGSGIAHALAAAGYEVALRDVRPELVERGLGVVRELFADTVRRGKLSPKAATVCLNRIRTTTAWDGFATCDLVVEAIVEEVEAKRRLFTELACVVRPDTVLASNTSALPIEEIAGHLPHPERTLGLHFFNPVSRMPLIELILGRTTSAPAAARALALVRSLGKSPVIARSSPGFLMTRVLFFYLNEAVRLWEQGVPAAVLDTALRDFGWPMGPLRLIDEIGVDVSDFIIREMARYFPERFTATSACGALLAAGLHGRKNGAGSGFYTYQDGRETVNEAAPRPAAAGPDRRDLSPEAITGHLMGVMIDEARRCLDEGIVRSADDVDYALLTGAGFPAFRGGLLRYARNAGLLAGRAHRSGAPAMASATAGAPLT
ncbi:MAG: 3-hydroxyacyl-CoA dehydrogenase NAD-binding domain-containing protein [Verrucomicrobiota bacterium]